MKATNKPILCYVTDSRSLAGCEPPTLEKMIATACRAGVDWVQVREKHLSARELLRLAKEAMQIGGAKVIVNDRLDVAVAAGAAGVHLGGESLHALDVAAWRREGRLAPDFLVGVSCHDCEESALAELHGADYIFFGPVFPTPSKNQFGPPQGLARLQEVCRRVRISVLAIGGITVENAASCLQAGASGIAAIRLFQEAENFASMLQKLWQAIQLS